ncbi:MAG: hypothetical protein F6K31_27775 [Symploca sp. SIO2G7]|nr:hypothetical protein [Symploca sp. SIO2G7]
MNLKRLFGTVVAFAFFVAVAFGVQVDSASAATDVSLSELSQGGTLVAEISGQQSFQYNYPYYLRKGQTLSITDTPENLVIMAAQNDSPSYSATLIVTYSQESLQVDLPANDREPKIQVFNPKNSRLRVTNFSTSSSSDVEFSFQQA